MKQHAIIFRSLIRPAMIVLAIAATGGCATTSLDANGNPVLRETSPVVVDLLDAVIEGGIQYQQNKMMQQQLLMMMQQQQLQMERRR